MDAERTQASAPHAIGEPSAVTAVPAFFAAPSASDADTDACGAIDAATADAAAALAERLQTEAAAAETSAERRARLGLGRLVEDRAAMAAATVLLDVAVRPSAPERVASAVVHVLRRDGLPATSWRDRILLGGFRHLWHLSPRLAVETFMAHLRARTRTLVRTAEPERLATFLAQRRAEGVTVNLNLVGEAVLGPDEAERRLRAYETALADPAVEAIAVKLSSLVPGIHPLAAAQVVAQAVTALRRLYRAAAVHGAQVSLDMEEFRDLEPTLAAFIQVSAEDEFAAATHGIALQAYLPESSAALRRVLDAARSRVAAGGAPLRVRLVKGANLAAERQQAAIEGWTPAPFATKADVDAHFRHLLSTLLWPANAAAVHVGVASHNVFDVALAISLAHRRGTTDALCIEMLEGMSEPLRRVVAAHHPRQLVYAPIATDADFGAAIAYLIRRFDEQTGDANFLRQNFRLQVGDVRWLEQRRRFVHGAQAAADVATTPRRTPAPADDAGTACAPDAAFANLASADWTLAPVRERLTAALADPPDVAVAEADADTVAAAIALAHADPDGWASRPLAERRRILLAAARGLAARRGEAWALLAHEGAKPPAEADPEFCEAVDALTWYARALDRLAADARVLMAPKGVVAVLPPFNFPLAIPLGGIAAALIGGNRVVVKPSPATPACARLACEVLWAAGVPRTALHLLHGGPAIGAALAQHPATAAIVFTGSTGTARRILAANPRTPLLAETGGKNVQIVTATADRDLAIANIVRGAFGHAGQKCSASSLVIAESEVFDDPSFRRRLVDAARVLRCGPATDPATDIAPLVQPPNAALRHVLTHRGGADWALTPEWDGDRRCSAGVLWDVAADSVAHREELFGPVVGVMRADSLDTALELVHASGYGLTSGLQSLDRDEWAHWAQRCDAGNLYVNRPTTGAVVGRQPFGGWGLSGFGPGVKAGGPDYAAELVTLTPTAGTGGAPTAYDRGLHRRLDDPAACPGQRNVWRQRPVPGVVLRIEAHDDAATVRGWKIAAAASGAAVAVSDWHDESAEQLADRLRTGTISRIVRTGTDVDAGLRSAAARQWVWICARPRTGTDADVRAFLRAQTISADVHRHGWCGPSADALDWLTD